MTALVMSAVVARPPRSGVFTRSSPMTASIARRMLSCAALLAQMVEHHGSRPDSRNRVRHALAGDVGRGPVNRLEHRRRGAIRVDVAARADAKAAGDGRSNVRQNVAEEVGRDDHVERLRMRNHARRKGVDVIFAKGDVRKIRGHFGYHLVPHDERMVKGV